MASTPSQSDPQRSNAEQAVSFNTVLNDELDEIQKSRLVRKCGRTVAQLSPEGLSDETVFRRADDSTLVGLAFSGGGIRSATFNLGILQTLASNHFLAQIDYLSTVSGGGYIGSWFAACVRNLPPAKDAPEVERVFLPDRDLPSHSNEPIAVTALRDYSNYLTPRLGLFSADALTMVAIYARNLFLNLLIIIGALAAVILLPSLVFLGTWRTVYHYSESFARYPLAALGLLLLFAVTMIAFNLETCEPESVARFNWLTSTTRVQLFIILPVVLAVWTAAIWFVPFILYRFNHPTLAFWVIAGTAANCSGWLVGLLVSLLLSRSGAGGSPDAGTKAHPWTPQRLLWRIASALVAGATGGVLLFGVQRLVLWLMTYNQGGADMWQITMWVPPALLGVLLVTLTLQIGIAKTTFSEQNREWFARLGAYFLLCTAVWLFLYVLASPQLSIILKHVYTGVTALVGWLGISVSGVLAGNSDKTGKPGTGGTREIIARVAPYVFAVGLLVLISLGLQNIHGLAGLAYPNPLLVLYSFAGLVIAVAFLADRVDINLFSVNLFYRNRLIRCYLGASRSQRQPQPFTGFDQRDDFAISDLRVSKGYAGPYPIFNTALNLVHGDNLAWQERKAESFIFSPIYSGYDLAEERRGSSVYLDQDEFDPAAYRPTGYYGYRDGGINVGTAMAISGAAASPNMGCHSSPAVTFLMTVFNVRLGWWLGNPRHKRTWRNSSPPSSLLYLVFELLGMTNDERGYVYLSDGGHFENLGIYELVRRRCRFIIACDAGQDGSVRFDDLGSAIQKCRTDFGVNITDLDLKELKRGSDGVHSTGHFAIGTIDYGNNVIGKLLYIKPSLTGGTEETVDVMNYQLRHKEFPHESTADQWFSESQFESYRRLGQGIGELLFSPGTAAYDELKTVWRAMTKAAGGNRSSL